MTSLSIYLLTFNCARTLLEPELLSSHLWTALPSKSNLPDVLVISLQEIAPIGYSFLGGSLLTAYFNAFRQAVNLASKDTKYINLLSRNVGLTAIMLFVKEDVMPNIDWLQTAGVGVGLHEMGNKGAAAVRMGYKTDNDMHVLTFISAHLAPFEELVQRRNEDFKKIVKNLVFQSESSGKSIEQEQEDEDAPLLQGNSPAKLDSHAGMYATSYLFIAGDLNYRTSEFRPSEEDMKKYPTLTENSEDPKHFSQFFERDQLSQQMRKDMTMHGFSEAPIDFPPTYKYNPISKNSTTEDWKWATHRWPSWCDRILYLDLPSSMPEKVEINGYEALPLLPTSDHRAVALSVVIILKPILASEHAAENLRDTPPFTIDPKWRATRAVARRKEIMVGVLAYLSLTWEGRGLLIATAIGVVGGWLILKALLAA